MDGSFVGVNRGTPAGILKKVRLTIHHREEGGHNMLKLAAVLVAGFVTMSGWAVVTVKDLPEYFVAGQQYTIEFHVRQHGRTLLSGLRPQLVIESAATRDVVLPAVARPAEGAYAVTFTAPAAGQVQLTISSGFGNSQLRLYPQTVVAAG